MGEYIGVLVEPLYFLKVLHDITTLAFSNYMVPAAILFLYHGRKILSSSAFSLASAKGTNRAVCRNGCLNAPMSCTLTHMAKEMHYNLRTLPFVRFRVPQNIYPWWKNKMAAGTRYEIVGHSSSGISLFISMVLVQKTGNNCGTLVV